MAYKVIIQKRAQLDIDVAYVYIKLDNPEAAAKWYARLNFAIQTLSELPARCALAPESMKLGSEIRQLIFDEFSSKYRIIFRVYETTKVVRVLTVRHGSRKALKIEDLE